MSSDISSDPEYWVYMLACSDQSIYIGIAKDVSRRIQEHNHSPKGAKYTKARRPVKLIYLEPSENRSLATKREMSLKKTSRETKLKQVGAMLKQSQKYALELGLDIEFEL